MNELDQARAVVDETVIRAQRGEGLDILALADNWHGSQLALLSAAVLAAIGREDPDPNPAPRDGLRAAQFLAGWATSDPAVFSPAVEAATKDGRMQHLLAAVAEHAVLALGLRDDPHQLAELRRSIALWTQQDTKEN
ncbi:hypothetical protein ACTWP6_29410 [Mycobacterium sp. 4D054]|uniref:hypothetical protein n=1 Tax=Mycobacterium sp. 4D054 TaxID=3457440 RepID=UPI003FD455D7